MPGDLPIQPTEEMLDDCWRRWIGDGPGEIPRRFRQALDCEQRDFEYAIRYALEWQVREAKR